MNSSKIILLTLGYGVDFSIFDVDNGINVPAILLLIYAVGLLTLNSTSENADFISSKNLLVDLINSNYLNVSINSLSAYDIILSVFLLLDYEYSIKYFLYILSIYLIPLLILSNFLYRQITEYSYYTIMRLKSYYIFIFNLISAIVIVSIVYFILGYSTIILMNLDKVDIQNGIFSILYKNNFSYFRLILRSLFINNLIITYYKYQDRSII